MSTMSVPESRARLGYLLSEMLSLPHLPEDLHHAVTAHLQQQLAFVNLLKPEYCLRLYPVLVELAELEAKSADVLAEASAEVDESEAAVETELSDAASDTPVETLSTETPIKVAEPEVIAESAPLEVASETPVETVTAEASSETPAEDLPAESVPTTSNEDEPAESVSETNESPEAFVENMPMAAIAGTAESANNPRTLW